MSRAEELAVQFEGGNGRLIEAVEACSGDQWRAPCAGEGWSVAVVAHHVAAGHEGIAGMVQTVATGGKLPGFTTEMINAGNAEHARQFAGCTKAETVELLRTGGAQAAAVVRGLSDDQLAREVPFAPMGGAPLSAQQLIENILIGHIMGHAQSVATATGS